MDGPTGVFLPTPSFCSVCLEAVNNAGERSIAKLTCGHQFHLDCIGSAFNAKGVMQCPNCRHTEHGQWLHAKRGRQREEHFFGDFASEREYNMLTGVQAFLISDVHLAGHVQLCPYQRLYTPFSLELGLADNQHFPYSDLVVDLSVGRNMEGSEQLYSCPVVLAQTPALVAHVTDPEENMRVQESGIHLQQGAWHQRQHPSSRGHWGSQHLSAVTPVCVAVGIRLFQDGSRRPYFENRPIVHTAPSQARRRQPIPCGQSVGNHLGSQFSSLSPHEPIQFTTSNPNRDSRLRSNAPFTRRRCESASAFQQYPLEREGQR